jgi:hypothetical protein
MLVFTGFSGDCCCVEPLACGLLKEYSHYRAKALVARRTSRLRITNAVTLTLALAKIQSSCNGSHACPPVGSKVQRKRYWSEQVYSKRRCATTIPTGELGELIISLIYSNIKYYTCAFE